MSIDFSILKSILNDVNDYEFGKIASYKTFNILNKAIFQTYEDRTYMYRPTRPQKPLQLITIGAIYNLVNGEDQLYFRDELKEYFKDKTGYNIEDLVPSNLCVNYIIKDFVERDLQNTTDFQNIVSSFFYPNEGWEKWKEVKKRSKISSRNDLKYAERCQATLDYLEEIKGFITNSPKFEDYIKDSILILKSVIKYYKLRARTKLEYLDLEKEIVKTESEEKDNVCCKCGFHFQLGDSARYTDDGLMCYDCWEEELNK